MNMKKNKNYRDLTKDKKKLLKEKFYNTEYGKITKHRLNRLLIYGICGFIVAFFILFTETSLGFLITSYMLLFISAVYLVASFILRRKEFNNFLNK